MKLAVVCAALAVVAGATACGTSTRTARPSAIVFAANREPTLTGEIYRLDPNGHRVDLSNSPFQDTSPSVSPDGTRVAFLSDRLGGAAVYEVSIDGRHLTLVARMPGPLYGHAPYGQIYWQPHGDVLAVGASNVVNVAIVHASHRPIYVSGASDFPAASGEYLGDYRGSSPWSPDGRAIVVGADSSLWVLSAEGRKLWSVKGAGTAAWSSQGLLAVGLARGVDAYDELGHRRFRVGLASASAWSPSGDLIAFIVGKSTVVMTASGARVLSTHAKAYGIRWIDNRHLAMKTSYPNCKLLDIPTGALTTRRCDTWFYAPRSADGKLAIVTPRKGRSFTLGVAPAAGGAVKSYGRVPGCASGNGGVEGTPAPDWLQFAGRTHSIVYENWGWRLCSGAPLSDLYEVEPDGSGFKRLTHGQGAMQPSVSPDGTQIAYALVGGQACAQRILVVSSSGALLHAHSAWDDEVDSPTWSPDGKTILYSGLYACGDANHGKLFTFPAAGGRTTYLRIPSPAEDLQPAWGPTRIAFIGRGGLVTTNPDGSDQTLIAKNGASPTWSESGELAYLVGNTVVAGSTRATLPFAEVASVRWAPDGSRLVVAARKKRAAGLDLYTVNPDGTGLVRLTTNFGVS